jgi:hypothetical protein
VLFQSLVGVHSTHLTPATTTSRSTGHWINTPQCHHLNVPHNNIRQLPEFSEHKIFWFHVIPRLVIAGILTTIFNQDFNNRRRYKVTPTPKSSDQCSFECLRKAWRWLHYEPKHVTDVVRFFWHVFFLLYTPTKHQIHDIFSGYWNLIIEPPPCYVNCLGLQSNIWAACTYSFHIYTHIYSFIQLAYAECNDSLPFSGASSIPLCYTLFLPLFSTNYSSILPYFILASISSSTSQSCCFHIHI